MKYFILIFSIILGISSIILDIFRFHILKKILSQEKFLNFEIGIRYQMYQALFLIILSFHIKYKYFIEYFSLIFIMLGTIFFSVSIYFICMMDYWNINLKFLNFFPPFGIILIILGWILLIWIFSYNFFLKKK